MCVNVSVVRDVLITAKGAIIIAAGIRHTRSMNAEQFARSVERMGMLVSITVVMTGATPERIASHCIQRRASLATVAQKAMPANGTTLLGAIMAKIAARVLSAGSAILRAIMARNAVTNSGALSATLLRLPL